MTTTDTFTAPTHVDAVEYLSAVAGRLLQAQNLSDQASALINGRLALPELAPGFEVDVPRCKISVSAFRPGTDGRQPALFAELTGKINGKEYTRPVSLVVQPYRDEFFVSCRDRMSEYLTDSARAVIRHHVVEHLAYHNVGIDDVKLWGSLAHASSEVGSVVSSIAHVRSHDASTAVKEALKAAGLSD